MTTPNREQIYIDGQEKFKLQLPFRIFYKNRTAVDIVNRDVNYLLKRTKMKNAPKKIFLQLGTDDNVIDFNECDRESITWCAERVYESDLEYGLRRIIATEDIPELESLMRELPQSIPLTKEVKTAEQVLKFFIKASGEDMDLNQRFVSIKAMNHFASQFYTSLPVSNLPTIISDVIDKLQGIYEMNEEAKKEFIDNYLKTVSIPVSGLVSVHEHPTEFNLYNIYFTNSAGSHVDSGYWNESVFLDGTEEPFTKVTHWMPLPNKP